MRFISTKFHRVLDYVAGILLIAAPWIFNFNNGTAGQWVPVVLIVGLLSIGAGLFTETTLHTQGYRNRRDISDEDMRMLINGYVIKKPAGIMHPVFL